MRTATRSDPGSVGTGPERTAPHWAAELGRGHTQHRAQRLEAERQSTEAAQQLAAAVAGQAESYWRALVTACETAVSSFNAGRRRAVVTTLRETAGRVCFLTDGNARLALSMATGNNAGLHVLRRGPYGGGEGLPAHFVLVADTLRIRAAGLHEGDPETAARWALEPWLRALTTD